MSSAVAKRVIGVMMGVVLLLGMAGPATAQTGGNQRFIVILSGSDFERPATNVVVGIGPIRGVGTVEFDEDNDDIVHLVFPQGTIVLDSPTGDDDTEEFDERTCSGSFTFSGPFEIVDATGAFAGATGSGQVAGEGRFIAKRTPEGCSEEESLFFFVRVEVTGNVSLSGQAAA